MSSFGGTKGGTATVTALTEIAASTSASAVSTAASAVSTAASAAAAAVAAIETDSEAAARVALLERGNPAPTKISITDVASVEVQLTAGRWRVHSDVKCYYRFGATGVAAVLATTADGHPLPADVLDYKTVDDPNTNGYVSLICDSGDTGTVTFSEQEDR